MPPKKLEKTKEPVRAVGNGGGFVPLQVFRTILAGINEAGIATVLLIIFLLMYMGILPSGVSQAFNQITKEHSEMSAVQSKAASELQSFLMSQQNSQLRLIRQICRNTAKNDTQAIECDR